MIKVSSYANGSEQQLDLDQERDRAVYRYLLTLTDLELSKRTGIPNETSIAKQWGVKDNRIFIRRVLRSVMHKEYYQKKPNERQKSPPPVPGLSLFRLVNILTSLQAYKKQRQQSLDSDQVTCATTITHAEILKALQLFSQLSSSERSALGIKAQAGEVIVQQILQKAVNPAFDYKHTQAFRLYNFFLKQLEKEPSMSLGEKLESLSVGTNAYHYYLHHLVSSSTEQYFSGLALQDRKYIDGDLVDKVKREINRISLQSGIREADRAFPLEGHSNNYRLYRYLTADFVERLVHSVVENELITDEFPVHLKFIEMRRVRPLPLYIKRDAEEVFALNPALLQSEDDQEADSVEGLERQVAYRIRLHFYIKLPEDYEVDFEEFAAINTVSGQRRLEFSEEVVGIGCPTSHIATVISRVLFWDIEALKDFMPIVNGIHCNDEIVGETPNSPMWSHCMARIYKWDDIVQAIASDKHRDEVATSAETAIADFCGFDLLETTAKAALLVRLKLVKQILSSQPHVSATDYINQLCKRIEESTALKRARQCLTSYPFSLRAMEGKADATIFKDRYRRRKPGYIFKQLNPGALDWSAVALEAHLDIAEANLKEGLSHIGKRYLEAIRPYFENDGMYQVSNSLKARHCLCWFRYYYLGDLEHQKTEFPDRYFAIRQAEEELNKADRYLTERLKRYVELNELPQVNLHPHFHLLSIIHAHRAKLYIFFPRYMQKPSFEEALLEPIKLLEKARIYAARDGDSALYAQWSAYQSWCYIMLAYLNKSNANFQQSILSEDFDYQKCFEWAEQLTEHAAICFSPTGYDCYREIKDGAGKTTEFSFEEASSGNKVATYASELSKQSSITLKSYEKYGSTMIEAMPLIKELYSDKNDISAANDVRSRQDYHLNANVIAFDFSLLKDRKNDVGSSIYLFGMQSAILLFSQGMLVLCKRYETDKDLVEAVNGRAIRLFNYCYAISSDGTHRNPDGSRRFDEMLEESDPDLIVLNRFFPPFKQSQTSKNGPVTEDDTSRDRLLRCLYPHRLTQFADLSSIFIMSCELILLVTSDAFREFCDSYKAWVETPEILKQRVTRIEETLQALRVNNDFPFPVSDACGQRRYNGHLAEHYVQIEKSVKNLLKLLKSKELSDISAIDMRDLVVTEFFRIIRGETSSISSDQVSQRH